MLAYLLSLFSFPARMHGAVHSDGFSRNVSGCPGL
jgi:hypothetical protein